MEKRRFESFEVFSCLKKVNPRILSTFKRSFSKKMGRKTSSHIIHSLGGEYWWIVRDSEPIRLLKSPRSLSVYILTTFIYLKTKTLVEHDIGLAPILVIWSQQIRAYYLRPCNPEVHWCELIPRLILLARWRLWDPDSSSVFRLLPFVSGHERTETFSIRVFMANRKPENVMWPRSCGRVCRLEFTFERQEGLSAVSDLRQGFFLPLKIVQPHV